MTQVAQRPAIRSPCSRTAMPRQRRVRVERAQHLAPYGSTKTSRAEPSGVVDGEDGRCVRPARLGHRDDRGVGEGALDRGELVGVRLRDRGRAGCVDLHQVGVQQRLELEAEQVDQARSRRAPAGPGPPGRRRRSASARRRGTGRAGPSGADGGGGRSGGVGRASWVSSRRYDASTAMPNGSREAVKKGTVRRRGGPADHVVRRCARCGRAGCGAAGGGARRRDAVGAREVSGRSTTSGVSTVRTARASSAHTARSPIASHSPTSTPAAACAGTSAGGREQRRVRHAEAVAAGAPTLDS